MCPHGFVRCNNSTLVNMRCIENVSAGSVRVDGRDIPVSRSRAKDLMRVLNEYIGV